MAKWKSILVGVDGSQESQSALRWAAEEAEQHGAELVALSTWSRILPAAGTTSVSTEVGGSSEDAAASLIKTITDTLGENPPVRVQPVVKEGSAAKALIEASANADLMVVGSRGHGGFAGLLLGSVSQQVIAHSDCSVVVVR